MLESSPNQGAVRVVQEFQTSPQSFRFDQRRVGSSSQTTQLLSSPIIQNTSPDQDSYYLAVKSTEDQKKWVASPQKDKFSQASPLRSILKNKEHSKGNSHQYARVDQDSVHLRRMREQGDFYDRPSEFSFEDGSKTNQPGNGSPHQNYPSDYQYAWVSESQDSKATARFNTTTPGAQPVPEESGSTSELLESQLQAKSAWLKARLENKLAKSQELLDAKLRATTHSEFKNIPSRLYPEHNTWQNKSKLHEISKLQQQCDELQERLSVTLQSIQDMHDEENEEKQRRQEEQLQWNLRTLMEYFSHFECGLTSLICTMERSSVTEGPSLRQSILSLCSQPTNVQAPAPFVLQDEEKTERIFPGRGHRAQKSVDWSQGAQGGSRLSDLQAKRYLASVELDKECESEMMEHTHSNFPAIAKPPTKHHRSLSYGGPSKEPLDTLEESSEARRFYLFDNGATVKEDAFDDEELIRLEFRVGFAGLVRREMLSWEVWQLESEKLAVESRIRAQKRQRHLMVERLLGCQKLAESIATEEPLSASLLRAPTQHYFARDARGELVPHQY